MTNANETVYQSLQRAIISLHRTTNSEIVVLACETLNRVIVSLETRRVYDDEVFAALLQVYSDYVGISDGAAKRRAEASAALPRAT